MKQSEWNRYQELKQKIADEVFDALYDNGFDPDEDKMPELITIYTKNDLSDVKVAIDSTHYEGSEDFNPDEYFCDHVYSLDEAFELAESFFDFRT